MTDIAPIARVRAGAVELAYETFGSPGDPPVLLVQGLGTQMIGWPDGLCAGLAARGLYVIRFDNRDIGLSTHLHDAPPADVGAALAGDTSSASYTLSDMAADTVALLDALGLRSAHVVGLSMGGMIAQTVAIEHPERVLTLTSIMSTTGDPSVGGATQEALGALLAPPASTREEAQERAVAGYRIIGSPGYRSTRRPCASAPARRSTAPTTRPGWDASSWPSSPPGTARRAWARSGSRPWSSTASGTRSSTSAAGAPPPRPSRTPSSWCSRGWATTCPPACGPRSPSTSRRSWRASRAEGRGA
jgi:pimeloyl-ACP methyl ester carboxylesterase